jgi:hypothetical protein
MRNEFPSPESEASKHRRYRAAISRVIEETAGESDIGIHLAIGAACTAITRREREIWLEEVKRLTPIRQKAGAGQ